MADYCYNKLIIRGDEKSMNKLYNFIGLDFKCPICDNELDIVSDIQEMDYEVFYECECPNCSITLEAHFKCEFDGYYNIHKDEHEEDD